MAEKLDQLGISYRPHFKTHQSAEIGSWYREYGVTKITVSSVGMASYFHNSGWNDITIAFPVTPAQFSLIDELSAQINLTVFINDLLTAQYFATNSSNKLKVIIEIDPDFGRSGLRYDQIDQIDSICKIIDNSALLEFYGFYIHDGRTYQYSGKNQIEAAIQPAIQILHILKSDFPNARSCLGDTPSASLLSSFPGIDELSPGNNIFYDLMQLEIGSCSEDKVAYAVACTVAQLKEEANEVVIYGGAVHFSKDRILQNNEEVFGIAIDLNENGFGPVHKGRRLVRLSQEHGILRGDTEWVKNLTPGDPVYIIPAHSCLSANLFDHYQSLDGMRIEKRILS
jgi:D-serine deaminase-like pyridoxal phosphate-dependent protein